MNQVLHRELWYDINPGQSVMAHQATLLCPFCQRKGVRRHGLHFDHEYRCPECQVVWEPGKVYLLYKQTQPEE